MDYASIKELIGIINSSDLTNFEMEFDGVSLKMSKNNNESAPKTTTTKEIKAVEASKLEYISESKTEKVVEEVEVKGGTYVNSPIVGTFYASAGSEKPAFVKVGDKVKKGDVLCIIEAMKIMNEIQSEVDGEIVEVLVSNEQMVEYGQKMFRIK
ncbi:acetyl-CoA carboxylase biotin carboxyl carrier protein [Clostridium folliculivorans]|uniref:Biotin carboxyl carrier protein of acetyl-CoA carboxylase n=1 Tax=Clostridium folliculivorans TaxID=2886038 RepID=A0A9W5Y363_9CLOT|nr:acetyl-CoA carboxylase biotin carboxyl carrier protein [Clostridium folliculivorans]GKU25703.1 acetyl-CoA carboxylase biotin carboxyl carrier protein subunit [Clostridium folliculivorans]GKU28725.1 acetyl-CoA carboxylase biotin carboxyl carrier protein subunit [Clostridium folliculivorans]